MPTDGAEITATYKEAEVSVAQYNNQEQSVNIYPNPLSGDLLTVDLLGYDTRGTIDVKISNLLGQTVYSNTTKNTNHLDIDMGRLKNNSIYLVSVKCGQSMITKKLIVE